MLLELSILLLFSQSTSAFQPISTHYRQNGLITGKDINRGYHLHTNLISTVNGNGNGNAHGKVNDNSITKSTSRLNMEINIPLALGGLAVIGGGALYLSGAEDREKKRLYASYEAEAKAKADERARLAYIEPREYWTEEDLAPYDGTRDEDGPILFAADGKVFNVYKGRHFYGPGCEYHVFAGKDATRLLAKGILEEETEEEKKKPLNLADRAALAGWMWTFEGKYDVVGELKGFDKETTSTRWKPGPNDPKDESVPRQPFY